MNGLVWGLIIALIALGLSIIFGLLDIINVAHGDFFMLGTVFAWTIILITGNFWIAFLKTIAATAPGIRRTRRLSCFVAPGRQNTHA